MSVRLLGCAVGLLLGSSSLVAAPAIEPAALRAAAAYSKTHGGLSFLLRQDGRTVSADNADVAFRIFSGTKAFWNLAALAAAEDGLLNLDERVAETIPAWKSDRRKARITVRQLLDFSSGLEPVSRLHNEDPGDRDAIALRADVVAEPGRAFIYGPAALQIFHAVLKAKLHGETPRFYLERRVLRPLGLGAQRYLLDRAGNPLLAAGWELTPRQWAKLGELVLHGGAPVVAPGSLAQWWRGSPVNRAYSLGWWNNRAAPDGREFDFERMLTPKWSAQNWNNAALCRAAPKDLVACIGSRYQRLYVIPSRQLVAVRNGDGRAFSDAEFLRLLLAR